MIKASEARAISDALASDKLRDLIDGYIRSDAGLGKRGTVVRRDFFGSHLARGIELVADELREGGYQVSLHYDSAYNFESMYITW